MNYLLIAETLMLMAALYVTLSLMVNTLALGMAFAMKRVDSFNLTRFAMLAAIAWGAVFFLHSVR